MYVIRVLIGFVGGVYVGTYYNCKPILCRMQAWIKANLPDEKDKKEGTFWEGMFKPKKA